MYHYIITVLSNHSDLSRSHDVFDVDVASPRRRSSLSTIDVELPSNASGVLFAVGGTSAGAASWVVG